MSEVPLYLHAEVGALLVYLHRFGFRVQGSGLRDQNLGFVIWSLGLARVPHS